MGFAELTPTYARDGIGQAWRTCPQSVTTLATRARRLQSEVRHAFWIAELHSAHFSDPNINSADCKPAIQIVDVIAGICSARHSQKPTAPAAVRSPARLLDRRVALGALQRPQHQQRRLQVGAPERLRDGRILVFWNLGLSKRNACAGSTFGHRHPW